MCPIAFIATASLILLKIIVRSSSFRIAVSVARVLTGIAGQDLFSVLSIVAGTLLWTLLVMSCSGKKKPKDATTGNKPTGDSKKPEGNPQPASAPPSGDPSKPSAPAAAPPIADPVDEGGDNYEDVNIGGGEPPPA